MFKLSFSPEQYAKGNLIRHVDLMSGEHFERNKKKVMERMKFNATANVMAHMTKMQCDVYVFSESELKELVRNIKK